MTLSHRILAENEAVLAQMLGHRFVADLTAGTLPAPVFDRYLAYEGAFVETAIGIFAFATARAPDLASRRWLIGVQQALAQGQMQYFEQVYARRGIAAPARLPRAAADFDAGLRRLAESGSFLEIVTAMFAAEWMYWTWCSRADPARIPDPDARRWVAMHAAPEFHDQALWLREAVDRHGGADDAGKLSAIFGEVMRLEIAFHNAPYDAEGAVHA